MPRPPIDLSRKLKDILHHVQELPDDARAPILHFRRTGTDIWGSLVYLERAVDQERRYQAVVERHLGRLYAMALVSLVQTFERFLKEVAAECVDCLGSFIMDDRFNVFSNPRKRPRLPLRSGNAWQVALRSSNLARL